MLRLGVHQDESNILGDGLNIRAINTIMAVSTISVEISS